MCFNPERVEQKPAMIVIIFNPYRVGYSSLFMSTDCIGGYSHLSPSGLNGSMIFTMNIAANILLAPS
jgi:hypothetical protein